MAANCRFAFAVHVMSVLALHPEEVFASVRLAQTVNTNPVTIRRLLLDLQAAGLVQSRRGPQGGAWLSREPSTINVMEILQAVDEKKPYAGHPQLPAQECLVGRRIQEVMDYLCERSMRAVQNELGGVTLADVIEKIQNTPHSTPELSAQTHRLIHVL
jgi:Rrf2 family protein